MAIFVTAVLLLFSFGLFTVINLVTSGQFLIHIFGWFGLPPTPAWWQQLIFFAALNLAAFLLLMFTFVRAEIRLAYRNRRGLLYSLFHDVINSYLGCKGQWWVPWFLVPISIFHALDIRLVIQGQLEAAWWCAITIGVVGLWGNYLIGESQLDNARDNPVQPPPTPPEATTASHPILVASAFVERLRELGSYHGQIAFQISSPVPDASPAMPLHIRKAFQEIQTICDGHEPEYAEPADMAIINQDPLLRETFRHLVAGATDQLQLFRHQGQVLRLLEPANRGDVQWNPAHVILATPMGSGRTTIALLAALRRVFNEHACVLIAFPDRFSGEPQARRFLEALQSSPWGWAVSVEVRWPSSDSMDTGGTDRPCPDILITSLDFLHQALLPAHEQWQFFFQQLGLIILDDFDDYTGVFGLNMR